MSDSEGLETKLKEYKRWAVGSGKYAFSTVERRERRIKYLSRHFDVWEPDLNSIYNFVIP